MSCKYYFKNKLIGNELDLNSFLLFKFPNYKELGDYIFQLSQYQNAIERHLINSRKAYAKLNRQISYEIGPDGEVYEKYGDNTAIGTSKFISEYVKDDGSVISPYFDKSNYWKQRFEVWSHKNSLRKLNADGTVSQENEGFTEEEALILGNNLTTLNFDKGCLDAQGNIDFYKLSTMSSMRAQYNILTEVEKRWNYQAKLGIAIHNIYATYFKRHPNTGEFQYLIWEKNPSTIKDSIDTYFKDPKSQGYIADDLLTETQIEDFIKKAKELRIDLENKFLTEENRSKGETLNYCIESPISATMSVHTNNKETGNPYKVLAGRIDLTVITPAGDIKVLDFKIGNKSYEKYDSAKRLGYVYQLSFYNRMLQLLGVVKAKSHIEDYIVPIEVENIFGLNNNNFKFKYNKDNGLCFRSITTDCSNPTVLSEVNHVLPYTEPIELEDTELVKKHEELMKYLFGKSLQGVEQISDEDIENIITNNGTKKIEPNESGNYVYEVVRGEYVTVNASIENAKAKFIQYVKEKYISSIQSTKSLSNKLLSSIDKAIETGTLLDINEDKDLSIIGQNNINKLNKYCSGKWNISLNPNAEQLFNLYNIMIFESKDPITDEKIIEVVKLDRHANDILIENTSSGRTNCNFKFASNDEELSNPESLMLKGLQGNISLLEIRLLLEEAGFKNAKINNIALMNPWGLKSKYFSASPEEIEYSLKHTIYKAKNLQKFNNEHFINNFQFEKSLKSATQYDKFLTLFEDLMSFESNKKVKDLSESFTGLVDSADTTQESIDKLQIFIKDLESKYPYLKTDHLNNQRTLTKSFSVDSKDSIQLLYLEALMTLTDLQGFKLKQETKAHGNLDSLAFATEGISGNQIDNSGNFKNYYVNEVSKLIINTIQELKTKLYDSIKDNRDLVKKLDEGLNSNFSQKNPTSRFTRMTYVKEDKSDVLFINPWAKDPKGILPVEFTDAHFNYLKSIILKYNKLKFPSVSEESIIKILSEGTNASNEKYLQVPLLPPSLASRVADQGLLKTFLNKFKPFTTEEGFQKWWKKASSVFTDSDFLNDTEQNIIFKVVNKFSQSDNAKTRSKLINDLIQINSSDAFYETNLELLIGLYEQTKVTSQVYSNVMPIIKGASVYLQQQQVNINENFDNDLQTIEELVKRNINDLSLGSEVEKKLSKVTGVLSKTASWLTLAFSPIQYVGQHLDGIVKLAKLCNINRGMEEAPFTSEELTRAYKIVASSIKDNVDNSLIEQLNILFGVNDMDINTYIDNMKYSKNYSIFNFDRAAFYTTSRPDFYNRMTLIIAQLIHEGSFDAYYLDNNKRIKYDMKKDLRFKVLFDGTSKESKEYKKALSKYIALVQLLNKENIYTPLNIDDIKTLDRGYTNSEIESFKALGDMLYGYYDNSKKSLFLGKWAGGLIGQMKTYISSKKNMYVGFKGAKNQIYWDKVVKDADPSVFLVYAKNEDGSINTNLMVWSDENNASDIVVLKPKGQVTLGIINSMWELIKNKDIPLTSKIFHPEKSLKQLCTNEDGTLNSRLYYSYIFNFRMLIGDIIGMILLGFLANLVASAKDAKAKDAKDNRKTEDQLCTAGLNLLYRAICFAEGDSNPISSLVSPFTDWNPFCLGQLSSLADNASEVINGKQSFIEAVLSSTAVTKTLIKPWYKDDDTGDSSGGGGASMYF